MDNIPAFGLSFLLNGGIALCIVRYIYSPTKRDKAYVLTFLTFNTLVFLIASLLNEVNFSLGFGLSLFAIFRILRFRTDPIPIREMTYQIVMMALAIINAMLVKQEAYTGLLIANLTIVMVLLLVEKEWGLRNVSQKTITYERIEWIRPEHYQDLLADLRARTGLDIIHCEVGKLDFLHDTAEIKITYTPPQPEAALLRPPATADYSGLFSTIKPRG